MIRIAAVGDVHVGADATGRFRPALQRIGEDADVLLLAGDLTRYGTVDEAKVVAEEFADLEVPVLAVLGNHDHHSDVTGEVTEVLGERGIRVLEGQASVLEVDGHRLAVAGAKGFGGGFAGRCGSNFGEREMKALIEHTEQAARRLRTALDAAEQADVLVALMHYSPVPETLRGEPPEIFPFLGSYQLADAVDGARGRVDLAVHGHAHAGAERGATPGGVPVRNVAQSVVGSPYAVYELPGPR